MRFLKLLTLSFVILAAGCATQPKEEVNQDTIIKPVAVQPGSQEELVVSVGDRVFFTVDKARLTMEARSQVESWANWMKKYPQVKVMIEGHCDERGTREYNYALGEKRAHAVKRYLVQLGIDPHRLSTTSYGKDRPSVLGSSEGSWNQNRRGVLVVQ